jgi:hypothetical protein
MNWTNYNLFYNSPFFFPTLCFVSFWALVFLAHLSLYFIGLFNDYKITNRRKKRENQRIIEGNEARKRYDDALAAARLAKK